MQLATSGQIGDLFTPLFHEIHAQHGLKHARAAFSAMTNVMVVFALVVAIVAALFAGPVVAILVPGFGQQDMALTAKVFVVVAPIIVLLVTSSMFMHLLRAEHRYGVSETLSLLSRVVNLVSLLLFARLLGVWALILGLWMSAVILLLGQIIWARREGYRHRFVLDSEYFHPRTVIQKIPLTFTHVFSAQFFAFALTAGLSVLPEGSFAAYSYAKRLHSKFSGIVLQPIGIVFFNHFSRAIAQGSTSLRSYADHAMLLSVAVVTLCFVPIVAGGDYLLAALWGGDKFPPDRIYQSYLILCVLTGLLIFNAQYLVARRTNLALKVVGPQFAASGTVMVVLGLLCYWLIPTYGLSGAVVIQAIASIGTASATLAVLFWVRRDLVCVMPLGRLMQWALAATISLAAVWFVRQIVPEAETLSRIGLLSYGILLSVLGAAFLLALSLLLKIPESRELFQEFQKRVRRWRGIQAEC